MKTTPLKRAAAVGLVLAAAAHAESPYQGLETRELKALSAEQIAAYENGEGMGLALPAELNRYPGPKHVIELAAELGLTDDQLDRTRAVFTAMHEAATALGTEIVDLERRLDRAFVDRTIDDLRLESLLTRIGERQARLRGVHLSAHLRMVEVLDQEQIEAYEALRGYGAGAEHHHGGHHGGHHGSGQPTRDRR